MIEQPIYIYFIRHGETAWNTEKRLQGQLDSPLTENGIQQIQTLFPELVNYSIQRVITSPLGRALSSAKLISEEFNLPLLMNDNLKERHFGDWQGELFESLTSKKNFHSVLLEVNHIKPNGGETGLSCATRMYNYLMSLVENKTATNSLIMTHGEILRCFLSQLKPLNGDNKNQLSADAYSQYRNGKIFKVAYLAEDQKFYLV